MSARTGRKSSLHGRKVALVALLVVALALSLASAARAVHDVGLFELDGNVADSPAVGSGEDWGTYFPTGSGSANATVFVADQTDPADTTYFTGGGSKDNNDVSDWLWTPTDQAPDKDEILNAYAASYSKACVLPSGPATCQYIYFGADRYAQNGDSQIGFWIFHNAVGRTGPATGGSFTGVHAIGDLLILSDFTNGGAISTIKVYEWVGFAGTGSDVPLNLVAAGVDCNVSAGSDSACGLVNSANLPVGWAYTPKSGTAGVIPTGGFYEGGINASAIVPGFRPCVSSFLAETRTSQSVGSQLKDFALGSFANCGARISITPSGTNEINDTHTFTAHLEVNAGGGFSNAPAGSTISFAKASGPGTLSASSCTTVGSTGSCSVDLTSAVAGVTVVNASATVSVGGATFNPTTDGTGGSSGPATKTWVDANIQISPDGTNEIGQSHTFTGHVNINTGTGGYVNAPNGTTIEFEVISGPGTLSASSCTTAGGTGSCTVSLTSLVPGVTTVEAATTVTVGGVPLVRTTSGSDGNSGPATKTWVDANIQIAPSATNEIGTNHTFTVTAQQNAGDGSGYTPAAGVLITGALTNSNGATSVFVGGNTCTTGAAGTCTLTISSPTAGQTQVSASGTITVGGVAMPRSTNGTGGNSGPATKTWVDANISIAASATNEIGTDHTFTVTALQNAGDGLGYTPAAGVLVTGTLTNSNGATAVFVGGNTCTTGAAGTCTLTINSPTAGQTSVSAAGTITVGGVPLSRSTNGTGGNSGPAIKTFVDARLAIAPSATNEIGTDHTFTVTATQNTGDGSGYGAAAGVLITGSLTNSNGATAAFVGGNTCTTSAAGTCTLTINSPTAGQTSVSASGTITVGGVPLSRSTNGTGGSSGPAIKTFVDANISITPSGTNEVGQSHAFTGHVNINTGTGGYLSAPDGTTINFAIATGPGTLSAPSCTTTGGTGSCSVSLTSLVTGITTVNASTTVSVGGVSLSRTTNGSGGNSGPATKTWVNANITIAASDTNSIGEAHTFTVTVKSDNGSGSGLQPVAGVNPTVTLSPVPSSVTNNCATTGTNASGQCTVTINSNTAGTFTANASITLNVGGVSLTRNTAGNSGPGGSGPATKTFVSGTLTWLKHDNQGRLLGGATFQVCRTFDFLNGVMVDNADVCVTVTDNSSPDTDPVAGQFRLTGLVLGRYTIRETVAPTGFNLDPTTQTVDLTIANPNGAAARPFVNTPRLTGQIAPTQTTCQTYTAGTAGDINEILYSVKDGKVNNAAPGVFFYFTTLTAPSASFTVNITQTVTPPGATAYLFAVHSEEVRLFNANCTASSLGTVTSTTGGQVSMNISGATVGQVFVISVKYSGNSSVGLPAPTPATLHMDFATKIGATTVDSDQNGLNFALKP